MAMAEQQPPIICRINQLDNVVKHLEEMSRGSRRTSTWESSSGSPSTCSSSPRSLNESFKHCRPLDDVVSETQHKGTLLYRLSHLEDRVLEVCLQLEKEMMEQRHNNSSSSRNNNGGNLHEDHHQPSTPTKKLKQFVKSCVKSKSNSKSKSNTKS